MLLKNPSNEPYVRALRLLACMDRSIHVRLAAFLKAAGMPDAEISDRLQGTTSIQASQVAEEYFDKAIEQLGL
jgi:hypothetical protein